MYRDAAYDYIQRNIAPETYKIEFYIDNGENFICPYYEITFVTYECMVHALQEFMLKGYLANVTWSNVPQNHSLPVFQHPILCSIADTQLCKRLCPSARPLVCQSVRP